MMIILTKSAYNNKQIKAAQQLNIDNGLPVPTVGKTSRRNAPYFVLKELNKILIAKQDLKFYNLEQSNYMPK